MKISNRIRHGRDSKLIGMKFGMVSIYEHYSGPYYWTLCDCGIKKVQYYQNLKTGKTVSCGCYRSKITRERSSSHNKTETKAYKTWRSMKERCLLENNNSFYRYGERGIKICEEWEKSFDSFYMDMGDPPFGYTLDRIDNNLGYNKINCKWSTRKEQANNTSRNRNITFNDKTQSAKAWSEEYNIGYCTFLYRIKNGWSIEKALLTPSRRNLI